MAPKPKLVSRGTIGGFENYHLFELHSGETVHEEEGEHHHRDAKAHWSHLRISVGMAAAFKKSLAERKGRRLAIMWTVFFVMFSGVTCAVPFELLNKSDRGCSNVILFAQYLWATFEGLRSGNVRELLLERHIPMPWHFSFLFLFGMKNVLYNRALDLGLPMPVYLVIKNGSLMMSMFLGWIVQSKKYNILQVVGVLGISAGLVISTFASKPSDGAAGSGPSIDPGTFLMGVACMLTGVASESGCSIAQEKAFSKYGKHFQEAMFYQYTLGLPLFLIYYSDIATRLFAWSTSWTSVPLLDIPIPGMWIMLLLNIIFSQAAKLGSLKLTSMAGALTNTLVVTLTRFSSLVFSAAVLNSPPFPPLGMWAGSLLVLGGTVLYLLFAAPKKTVPKAQ